MKDDVITSLLLVTSTSAGCKHRLSVCFIIQCCTAAVHRVNFQRTGLLSRHIISPTLLRFGKKVFLIVIAINQIDYNLMEVFVSVWRKGKRGEILGLISSLSQKCWFKPELNWSEVAIYLANYYTTDLFVSSTFVFASQKQLYGTPEN